MKLKYKKWYMKKEKIIIEDRRWPSKKLKLKDFSN